MVDSPGTHPRFPIFCRLWKPAAVIGTAAVVVAAWFEDLKVYAEEILGLILLPILAGVIYLMDILFFKSRAPNREDLEKPVDRGAKK